MFLLLNNTQLINQSIDQFFVTSRLGAHRRVHTVGTEQDIRVKKVITHPSYHKPSTYAHDIALLKLEKKAQLNKLVISLKLFIFIIRVIWLLQKLSLIEHNG